MNDQEIMEYAEKIVGFVTTETAEDGTVDYKVSDEGEAFLSENAPSDEDQAKILELVRDLITAQAEPVTEEATEEVATEA